MSSDFIEPSPYESPPESATPAGNRRPGWLIFVAVVAIVLGAWMTLTTVAGLLAMAFQSQMQQLAQPQQQPPGFEKVQEMMDKFQVKSEEIANKYLLFSTLSAILILIVGVALLYGGVASLQRKSLGRTVLLYAAAAAIPLELGVLVLQTLSTTELFGAFRAMSVEMAGEAANDAQLEMVVNLIAASLIAGIVLTALFTLLKVVFHGVAIWYLRSEEARTACSQ